MAVKTELPPVNRVTTVSNVSKTERYPVERADNARTPPKTRPTPPPKPTVIPQDNPQVAVSKERSSMRAELEAQLRNRPRQPIRPRTVLNVPGFASAGADRGPPDGVGPGSPPPGGIKVR